MRGVVLTGDRGVAIREFEDPRPGPGEVVVQIRASGICGTDLHIYHAPASERAARPPTISGHEPCGVVAEVGAGVSEHVARVGDRVMVHHYLGCGVCDQCRIGYPQQCRRGHKGYGYSDHGGNAERILVGAETLVGLPDELSFAEGAALACGTGTAYMGLRRLEVSGRDTLAVFGQGPVGLSAMLLGKHMGARVIAVDVVAGRLALARELGADVAIDGSQQDAVETIRSLTGGLGADAAMDCSGHPTARADALRCARLWGRVCFIGIGKPATFDVSRDIINKQLTVYGSRTFSTVGLAECARFVVERKVPLGRLITHEFRLDEAEEAFRRFDEGLAGKCVFAL
jgi:L-iditol 2-dehydrogenase